MQILNDAFEDKAVLYDPAKLRALPIVFCGLGRMSAEREAEAFRRFVESLGHDPRELSTDMLDATYKRWRQSQAAKERP